MCGCESLSAFTKEIVDRCCCLRRLPCRNADLIEALDDITDSVKAWNGGLLVRIGQNATEIVHIRTDASGKLGLWCRAKRGIQGIEG